MPMAFQLLLVISGVESPTQATEDSNLINQCIFILIMYPNIQLIIRSDKDRSIGPKCSVSVFQNISAPNRNCQIWIL
jgi:hypothetical protein